MITILEVTPTEDTRYEVNAVIYDLIWIVLQMRLYKSVKDAVSNLPEDYRQHVKTTVIPKKTHPIRGLSSDVLYDEMRALETNECP